MQINICFYNFFFFTVFHVFPGVNCEVEGEKFRRLCWSNSISNIIKKIRSGRKQKRPWFLAERKGRHHTRAIVVHNLTKWSRPKKNTFLADMSAAEIPIFHDITKVFWQVLTSTHCKKFWNFFAYSCISENNTRMTETRTNKVRIPTKRENNLFILLSVSIYTLYVLVMSAYFSIHSLRSLDDSLIYSRIIVLLSIDLIQLLIKIKFNGFLLKG